MEAMINNPYLPYIPFLLILLSALLGHVEMVKKGQKLAILMSVIAVLAFCSSCFLQERARQGKVKLEKEFKEFRKEHEHGSKMHDAIIEDIEGLKQAIADKDEKTASRIINSLEQKLDSYQTSGELSITILSDIEQRVSQMEGDIGNLPKLEHFNEKFSAMENEIISAKRVLSERLAQQNELLRKNPTYVNIEDMLKDSERQIKLHNTKEAAKILETHFKELYLNWRNISSKVSQKN